MGRASDIAVIGALGIGAAVVFLNWKSITNMFNSPEAQAIGGTAAGVAAAVPSIVAIPYNVGTTIGGELGTAWGNIYNSLWGLWNRQGEQVTAQEKVTAAITDVQQKYQTAAASPTTTNTTAAILAERSYIQSRIDDLQLQYERGIIPWEVYQSVKSTLEARPAYSGPTPSISSTINANNLPPVQIPGAINPNTVNTSAAIVGVPGNVTGTASNFNPNDITPWAQPGSPAWNAARGLPS